MARQNKQEINAGSMADIAFLAFDFLPCNHNDGY